MADNGFQSEHLDHRQISMHQCERKYQTSELYCKPTAEVHQAKEIALAVSLSRVQRFHNARKIHPDNE